MLGLWRTFFHQEQDEWGWNETHGENDSDSIQNAKSNLSVDHILQLVVGVVHGMIYGLDSIFQRINRRWQWRSQYYVVDGVQIRHRRSPSFVIEPNLIQVKFQLVVPVKQIEILTLTPSRTPRFTESLAKAVIRPVVLSWKLCSSRAAFDRPVSPCASWLKFMLDNGLFTPNSNPPNLVNKNDKNWLDDFEVNEL